MFNNNFINIINNSNKLLLNRNQKKNNCFVIFLE